jgi:hypothetical protein
MSADPVDVFGIILAAAAGVVLALVLWARRDRW